MRFLQRTIATIGLTSAMLLLSPQTAEAGLQAVYGVGMGWSSNVLGVPSTQQPISAFVGDVRPGLLLGIEAERAVYRLSYQFGYQFVVNHSEANGYNNALAFDAGWVLSKRVEFGIGADISQGRVATLTAGSEGEGAAFGQAGAATARANGTVHFVLANVAQRLGYDLSNRWRFAQSTGLSVYVPLPNEALGVGSSPEPAGVGTSEQARTLTLTERLEITKEFTRDALGIEISPVWTTSIAAPSSSAPASTRPASTVTTTAIARHRHDYDPFWSTTTDLGVAMLATVVKPIQTVWNPALRFTANMSREEASFQAGVGYTITQNLLAGDSFRTANADVSTNVPLGRLTRPLVFSLLVGYQLTQPVLARASAPSASAPSAAPAAAAPAAPTTTKPGWVHALSPSASLNWVAADFATLSLAYSYYRQFGNLSDTSGADATSVALSQGLLPDIERHSVMLNLSGAFPGDETAEKLRRRRSAAAIGRSTRADNSDSTFAPSSTPKQKSSGNPRAR
jgi:hypothetical protein